ncbi:hypothetical protein SODALDRAFT_330932, partial [Sodiomyces alkalinus F11]
MAATRSPSPSPSPVGCSNSPSLNFLLSPRSRLEARLAAIDTSSDEDDSLPTSLRRRKPSSEPTTSTQPATAGSEDESDGDDIRPRGRLAAQMQAGLTRREANNDEDQDADDDDDDDDQDIISAAPRRLKRKITPRASTPPPRSPSVTSSVASSPGLFVTRHPSPGQEEEQQGNPPASDSGSDSDELPSLTKNPRFQALLERKRKERLAKEAEEERKRQERMARLAELGEFEDPADEEGDASSIADDEGGRRLTQGARPPRRAGKKALEEMHRETQRMARNMQLAHEAKTRKKITKASLFERFKFKTPDSAQPVNTASSSRPTTPTSPHHTDTDMKDAETPPSSPPRAEKLATLEATKATAERTATELVTTPTKTGEDMDEFPALEAAIDAAAAATAVKVDKGKGLAVDSPRKAATAADVKPRRKVRVKLPPLSADLAVATASDDELEITQTRRNKLDAIFDRVPEKKAQQGNSMHALRILAQLKSPGGNEARRGKDHKPSMTPGELQLMLYRRARQQAKEERDRRMEMLKAKGIVVQTEEERENELRQVDDIVARARLEAEEIMRREKEAAKEERRRKVESGELDPLAWDDSSDDEEYQGSDAGQEDDEDAAGLELELELSGSEAEGEAELGVEDKSGHDEETQQPDSDEEGIAFPARNIRRPKKHVQVVSDDDEEEDGGHQKDMIEATPKPKTTAQVSPAPPKSDSPAIPTSVLRSAKKSFIPGLPVVGAAGLGLTQIFAGTMDDGSQDRQLPESASMALPMPSPTCGFPSLDLGQDEADTQPGDEMVFDSQGGGNTRKRETQANEETKGVQLRFTQSQMHGFDSLLRQERDVGSTQLTMEPSQDVGLQEYTPLRERFIEGPASTAHTVTLDRVAEDEAEEVQDSPLVRRGRLRLRRKMEVSDEEEAEEPTAFEMLQAAARKEEKQEKQKALGRKKSKAREMFEEQAEESEDEYAGLGGADGEDSSGDEDSASIKDMIDDEAGKDDNGDDERKIAALYADRERARDEQIVDKLFRDVTTGMLRRKRGADYGLSDSDDDGGEARRRLKRRQFAKMQKALFADERIKKMAEKPGNQAFLRTIEDRGSDEEMDFLDIGPDPMDVDVENSHNSSSSSQDQTVPDSQPQAESRAPLGTAGNRGFANPRRTKDAKKKKKPSNIGEIRESLSSLLEEPEAPVIPVTEVGSDSSEGEDDEVSGRSAAAAAASRSDKENTSPRGRNRRRTGMGSRPAAAGIIDRMSLKRESSSNASTHSRVAFARSAAGGSGSSGFKVPALLRRATTNSLSLGGSASTTTTTTSTTAGRHSGAGFDEGVIKKAAGKRSTISALARETERRAAMAQGEKRREAKKWKGAEMRGKAFGGLIGAGKF